MFSNFPNAPKFSKFSKFSNFQIFKFQNFKKYSEICGATSISDAFIFENSQLVSEFFWLFWPFFFRKCKYLNFFSPSVLFVSVFLIALFLKLMISSPATPPPLQSSGQYRFQVHILMLQWMPWVLKRILHLKQTKKSERKTT